MTFVPEPGAMAAAAAEVLKKITRAEGSGYDEYFIDMISEEYEYLIVPDRALMPRREVDRNLDKMVNAATTLLDTLRRSRDNGLTEAFHSLPLENNIFDRQRLTIAAYERWTKRLISVAQTCRLQSGQDGRRNDDQPSDIANRLAKHFYMLTRKEPTLSKKDGANYCACIAKMFAVLRLEADPVAYARKAIHARTGHCDG